MNTNTSTFAEKCIQDATECYLKTHPNSKAKAKIITEHEQVWGGSDMGSGGIGLCVITQAPTAVVQIAKQMFVYHEDYQYDIDTSNINETQSKNLKSAIASKNLPGKMDADKVGGKIEGRTYGEHVQHRNNKGLAGSY